MCPPRRGRRGAIAAKGVSERGGKANAQQEPPKPTLQSGAGWILENYQYMKTIQKEKQLDGIYKIFGIPMHYKTDNDHAAVQLFTEFQLTSFTFAQQFADAGKALMILMLFSDYIGNVPSFSSSKDSFAIWVEKATKIIQNSEFTPQEQQLVTGYINGGLRSNAHVLHYVLTHEAMKKLDAEGLQLFKPVAPTKKESTDENKSNDINPDAELEAQLAAAALAERGAAEAARIEAELKQAIETMVADNLTKIKTALDERNEKIVQQIIAAEEKIEGKPFKRV